jgi:hypothetical protein
MRLGIVGAGEVAWRHAAAAADVDGLILAAVTDRDGDRARRLADRYGARAVADLGALLAAVDLVVLAVPHAYHAELSLRTAAAGRRVLVEKPMATTVEDCDRMIDAAGDRLSVGHQGRFFAQVSAARAELAGLGAPLLYLERRSTDYARPDRPAWFADPRLAGGGIAMLVGVHSIDRACWLLRRRRGSPGPVALTPRRRWAATACRRLVGPGWGPGVARALARTGSAWEAATMISERVVDRTAGWLGVGFLVGLLASEAALSLPDEHATGPTVAAFYAAHRVLIIVLQLVGFLSAALLALFAWRLRVISRGIATAGLVLAVTALAPGLITLILALVADPQHPAAAGTYNRFEPRGDDLLFLGVTLFAVTVLVSRGRSPRWLGVVAATAALCCLLRLLLEALGRPRGVLDALAPLSFLLLIAALTWLSFRGFPAADVTGQHRRD